MIKHKRWILISLLCCSCSFALQLKKLDDNGTAYALLAKQGLTRIAVNQDRINDVKGPDGVYRIQNDPVQGAVFVEPLVNQKKPFTLFISTEHHHNYLLRLFPTAQMADSIVIDEKNDPKLQVVRFQRKAPNTLQISGLLNDLVKQKTPLGYIAYKMQAQTVIGSLSLTLTQIDAGAEFQGKIYRIKNIGRHEVFLQERDFYHKGDLAISLLRFRLKPQEETMLYKVVHSEVRHG